MVYRAGVFDVLRFRNAGRLTVLSYHRINNPEATGFDTFKPVVSATPQNFSHQMDTISRNYNVVSVSEVIAWLKGDSRLPRYPALITFDDGYADNYEHAFPVLQARGIPAVIFLTTNIIGSVQPFFWDRVAYALYYTPLQRADLPGLGVREWCDVAAREATMQAWIDALKSVSEEARDEIMAGVEDLLQLQIPEDAFAGLHLSWDQVREMHTAGITMGAHTVSHPNLANLSQMQVMQELTRSRMQIEREIKAPVVSFAYPYGLKENYNHQAVQTVIEAGFDIAFSLEPGIPSLKQVKQNPFCIQRVFLSHHDHPARFAAKLSGLYHR